MFGLMLKDIFAIKKQLRITFMIIIIYLIFSITTNNLQFLSFVAVFADLGVIFATFGFDEKCHWDKYAKILPISYKKVVLARYAEVFIINIGLFAILAPLSTFVKKPEDDMLMVISILTAVLSAGVIVLSIMFPIIYKYGIEKARILIFIIAFSPIILVSILNKLNVDVDVTKLLQNNLVTYVTSHVYIVAPIIAMIFLCVSYLISIVIVEKKEF